jgi:hypothetical protein
MDVGLTWKELGVDVKVLLCERKTTEYYFRMDVGLTWKELRVDVRVLLLQLVLALALGGAVDAKLVWHRAH